MWEMGILSYFPPYFSLIFLSLLSHFLDHIPPQPSTTPIPCVMSYFSPISPHFPPFLSISPQFPPVSSIFSVSPSFQTPKSWFGEMVSLVAVSVDA